jgi:hypothetical protein
MIVWGVVGVLRKLEVVLKWECGNVFGGVVFFAAHVSFEVRDGSRVLFWHDVWCEEYFVYSTCTILGDGSGL